MKNLGPLFIAATIWSLSLVPSAGQCTSHNSNTDLPTEVNTGSSSPTSQMQEKNPFVLFPNPVERLLYVSNPGFQEFQISVHDANGQRVFLAEGPGAATTAFNLQDLPAGTYFARISCGKEREVYQVYKK